MRGVTQVLEILEEVWLSRQASEDARVKASGGEGINANKGGIMNSDGEMKSVEELERMPEKERISAGPWYLLDANTAMKMEGMNRHERRKLLKLNRKDLKRHG